MSDTPILSADRDVWVVERNPGSGWRVSAVLATHEEAEQFEDDLREFYENMGETIKTRHGCRKSPTKMFEEYPPE